MANNWDRVKTYGGKLHENLIQRIWLGKDGNLHGLLHWIAARDIEIDFFAEWQQYQREADLRVAAQLRKIIRAVN